MHLGSLKGEYVLILIGYRARVIACFDSVDISYNPSFTRNQSVVFREKRTNNVEKRDNLVVRRSDRMRREPDRLGVPIPSKIFR